MGNLKMEIRKLIESYEYQITVAKHELHGITAFGTLSELDIKKSIWNYEKIIKELQGILQS